MSDAIIRRSKPMGSAQTLGEEGFDMKRIRRWMGALTLLSLLAGPLRALSETRLGKVTSAPETGVITVYAQAAEESAIVTTVVLGASVTILSTVGDWYEIQCTPQNGYVRAQYVTVQSGSYGISFTAANEYAKVNLSSTAARANVYQDTSDASGVLKTYLHGTVVRVVGKHSVWCQVNTGGVSGYMLTSQLSFTYAGGTTGTAYVKTQNLADKLNLYADPNQESSVLGSYATGTRVTADSTLFDWKRVVVDGKTGYMLAKHLVDTDPSVPTLGPTPAATPTSAAYAVVNNANPTARLNLREWASTTSKSLGQYYNGTVVRVLEYGPAWCRVEVDGIMGYMMTAYLLFGGAAPVPTPQPQPTASSAYAQVNNPVPTERLNLRQRPDTQSAVLGRYYNGTVVRVLQHGATWCQVEVGGLTGYMMTSYLYFGAGVVPTPAPTVSPSATYATVKNPVATQRLNLRDRASTSGKVLGKYYNGTRVRILRYGSDWCYVDVNGLVGYMMTQYLSFTSGSSGTMKAVVKNPVATQKLNLRLSASAESKSLGQYYNGTPVTVLEYGKTWCRVEVYGVKGYMMTKYLLFQ